MKRTKWNPRKVLVASAGVAAVNYAVAAGCGGETGTVANLVICPPSQCEAGNGGFAGASVANLVAPPTLGGSGGSGGTSGFGGASVANLVAPPPFEPDASAPDASPPPDDAGARDAAPDGAA